MDKISFQPIGVINTPFKDLKNMPIQPKGGKGIKGSVEIFPEYVDGLLDLDGFSHIMLLFHFHLAEGYKLQTKPFMEDIKHGVFAIRAPKRPNPIGLSIVRLISIRENILNIENLDIIDGTPLLDIKPYIPDFEEFDDIRAGWAEKHAGKVKHQKSDKRFND